jgi:cobalt-zinc-cadmium efflux system outer membrane protein
MTFRAFFIMMLAPALCAAAERAPLTLSDAVAHALAAGDVEARRFEVDEARARARQALARPNPVAVYDRQDIFDEGIAPGFVQDLVKVEQQVQGHRRRGARRVQGARDVDRATAEVTVAQRRRVHEVRRAFARALAAQEETAVYAEVLDRLRLAQEAIDARVAAGESSEYERARIELAGAQERDARAQSEAELARQRAVLAAAMAAPLAPGVRLAGALASTSPTEKELDRVAGAPPALPEVELARAKVELARADEGVARADARPLLTVGGGYMHFDQTGIPAQSGYNAVASVVLPLNDRREGEREAARARARAAQADLDAAARRAAASIHGAREAVRAAAARLEALGAQEERLQPLMEMARTSYDAGLHSLLELLDAYRVERDVRLQQIRARAALREALEDLAFAAGVDADQFTNSSVPAQR